MSHLQYNRQLLWRPAALTAVVEPHLEGCQLLSKERAMGEGEVIAASLGGQLLQAQVQCQVPCMPGEGGQGLNKLTWFVLTNLQFIESSLNCFNQIC